FAFFLIGPSKVSARSASRKQWRSASLAAPSALGSMGAPLSLTPMVTEKVLVTPGARSAHARSAGSWARIRSAATRGARPSTRKLITRASMGFGGSSATLGAALGRGGAGTEGEGEGPVRCAGGVAGGEGAHENIAARRMIAGEGRMFDGSA